MFASFFIKTHIYMSLNEKIIEVCSIFEEVDNKIINLKNKYKINCIESCGECCMKDNIEATVLEFLPAANFLLQNNNEDIIDHYYQQTEKLKYCIFFNPLNNNGKCNIYPHRGLICRLFGFAGRINKNNELEAITCAKLKYIFPKYNEDVPIIHNYYLRLSTIDPQLFLPFLPINKAIQKSIEIVSLYYRFKKTG